MKQVDFAIFGVSLGDSEVQIANAGSQLVRQRISLSHAPIVNDLLCRRAEEIDDLFRGDNTRKRQVTKSGCVTNQGRSHNSGFERHP